jgi:hypothetical protein
VLPDPVFAGDFHLHVEGWAQNELVGSADLADATQPLRHIDVLAILGRNFPGPLDFSVSNLDLSSDGQDLSLFDFSLDNFDFSANGDLQARSTSSTRRATATGRSSANRRRSAASKA